MVAWVDRLLPASAKALELGHELILDCYVVSKSRLSTSASYRQTGLTQPSTNGRAWRWNNSRTPSYSRTCPEAVLAHAVVGFHFVILMRSCHRASSFPLSPRRWSPLV